MYNNYSIYSYIENKQVQRIYHRLFGSKQKRKEKKSILYKYILLNPAIREREKEKEYSIQNKSSNNIKNKSSYLSAVNKKEKMDIIQLQYIL